MVCQREEKAGCAWEGRSYIGTAACKHRHGRQKACLHPRAWARSLLVRQQAEPESCLTFHVGPARGVKELRRCAVTAQHRTTHCPRARPLCVRPSPPTPRRRGDEKREGDAETRMEAYAPMRRRPHASVQCRISALYKQVIGGSTPVRVGTASERRALCKLAAVPRSTSASAKQEASFRQQNNSVLLPAAWLRWAKRRVYGTHGGKTKRNTAVFTHVRQSFSAGMQRTRTAWLDKHGTHARALRGVADQAERTQHRGQG